jgi:anion-transporting  ArsA/GET3 family ATPase
MEHLLDLAPPGLDDIIALTLIIEHIDQGRYDMIIVDAAPSGHLLRLLEMPALIRDWLRLFFALLLKYRQVLRLPKAVEMGLDWWSGNPAFDSRARAALPAADLDLEQRLQRLEAQLNPLL